MRATASLEVGATAIRGMHSHRSLVPWFALFVASALPAQSLGCHDLQAIAPISQSLVAASPVFGRHAVRLELPSVLLYEQSFGAFGPTTVVPIASATKTLSAALLMSLVDTGHVSLDDTVAQYLPEWNVGAKASITLRMCFSHTAGMVDGDPLISDDTVTLRQAAAQLANVPLRFAPGSTFEYGGVSMHVAGAVCEVATGQAWSTLFEQRIATPLQMTATDFFAFGPTLNPRIAGGARSNLREFARFMAMLRDDGVWNGVQVLSAASVQELLTAQTVGIPVAGSPHPYGAPYGIGIWIDRRDSQGRTVFASGVGAFGFAGWVDRAHDLSGTFAIQYFNQTSYPYLERIFAAIDAAVLPAGITCVGSPSPGCVPGAWLNATLPATTGNADFALRADRLLPLQAGAFVLGTPTPGGVPIGDLVSFVGSDFAIALFGNADAAGRVVVPVPLVGLPAGSSFGLQTVWLGSDPCLSLGLQASHAVRLDVLP